MESDGHGDTRVEWDEWVPIGPGKIPMEEAYDLEELIGYGMSKQHKGGVWERIVEQAGEREKEGLEVTLQTVSDGTMMGRGVMTKGAGAWVIPNPWTEEHKEFWEVAAGGSQVHEDPRWISSARAELMGLLSVTMFLVTRGWEHDVVHSLDSQAVVKRGLK